MIEPGGETFFRTGSLLTAGQFVQALVALADDLGTAIELDLRAGGVTVRLPDGDPEAARQVAALARELDLPADPSALPGPLHPVSVKGVVVRDGRVLLLENERGEWELPGGRLEPGESPQECVRREVREETGWEVTVGRLLDAYVFEVVPGRHVLVVTFACGTEDAGPPVVSDEHRRAGLFTPDELDALTLPAGYRRSVDAVLG